MLICISTPAGWLTKQGGGTTTFSRKNWKRRWFILQLPSLMYLESPHASDPLGVIPISSITAVSRIASSFTSAASHEEYIFSVQTAGRTYYMQGESVHHAQQWVWALAAARACMGVPRDVKMLTSNVSLENIICSEPSSPLHSPIKSGASF